MFLVLASFGLLCWRSNSSVVEIKRSLVRTFFIEIILGGRSWKILPDLTVLLRGAERCTRTLSIGMSISFSRATGPWRSAWESGVVPTLTWFSRSVGLKASYLAHLWSTRSVPQMFAWPWKEYSSRSIATACSGWLSTGALCRSLKSWGWYFGTFNLSASTLCTWLWNTSPRSVIVSLPALPYCGVWCANSTSSVSCVSWFFYCVTIFLCLCCVCGVFHWCSQVVAVKQYHLPFTLGSRLLHRTPATRTPWCIAGSPRCPVTRSTRLWRSRQTHRGHVRTNGASLWQPWAPFTPQTCRRPSANTKRSCVACWSSGRLHVTAGMPTTSPCNLPSEILCDQWSPQEPLVMRPCMQLCGLRWGRSTTSIVRSCVWNWISSAILTRSPMTPQYGHRHYARCIGTPFLHAFWGVSSSTSRARTCSLHLSRPPVWCGRSTTRLRPNVRNVSGSSPCAARWRKVGGTLSAPFLLRSARVTFATRITSNDSLPRRCPDENIWQQRTFADAYILLDLSFRVNPSIVVWCLCSLVV